jgi:hypothetical protein
MQVNVVLFSLVTLPPFSKGKKRDKKKVAGLKI